MDMMKSAQPMSATRESQVQGELGRQEVALAALGEALTELERRLMPVLRQPDETNLASLIEPQEVLAAIADNIRNNTYQISQSTDRVRNLLHLLEV